uniref:Chromo domain-containing protein n=1 Tax=Rhizophagus irregularis (strain DAOM 181602 / DAOM 197198 / MUCL 43194) TaxID=747089 RepID=U9T3P6_RHIID
MEPALLVDVIIIPFNNVLQNENNRSKSCREKPKGELQVVPTNEKPAPDSVIRGQPERYVPERILQHRIRKCQHQYLVTWECYPDTEATKVTLN